MLRQFLSESPCMSLCMSSMCVTHSHNRMWFITMYCGCVEGVIQWLLDCALSSWDETSTDLLLTWGEGYSPAFIDLLVCIDAIAASFPGSYESLYYYGYQLWCKNICEAFLLVEVIEALRVFGFCVFDIWTHCGFLSLSRDVMFSRIKVSIWNNRPLPAHPP